MPASLAQILLFRPDEFLADWARKKPSWNNVPWAVWGIGAAAAVLGSLFYGGTLGLVLPVPQLTAGALWLTLSSGLSWPIFGLALILCTKQSPLLCAQACLVTMLHGELVLALGGLLNILAWTLPPADFLGPVVLRNALVVLVSNLVMAASLTWQMQRLGVPPVRVLLPWFLVLDGVGALLFLIFGNLLLAS